MVFPEIDFDPKFENRAMLTGTVATALVEGQGFAHFRLDVRDPIPNIKREQPTNQYWVEVLDADVEEVKAKLQLGQLVHVQGPLRVDVNPSSDGSPADIKAVVEAESFLLPPQNAQEAQLAASHEEEEAPQQRSAAAAAAPPAAAPTPPPRPPAPQAPQQQQQQQQQQAQEPMRNVEAAEVPGMSREEQWRLVADAPAMWFDNRQAKREGRINPKSPDFKLKDKAKLVDVALWVSSKDTPQWAQEQFGQ